MVQPLRCNRGATDSHPEGIEAAPYFNTTKVAGWDLQEALTATGKDEKSFLSEIQYLSKFNRVRTIGCSSFRERPV